MTLKAKPGVSPGLAGLVTVRATGNEPSFAGQTGSGGVFVDSAEQMAQMKTTTMLTSGKVGGTFTATITARNDGPHTQPWMEYRMHTTGVELVSGTGCTTQTPEIVCRIENIAVGTSKTLKVTFNEWVIRDVSAAIPAPIGDHDVRDPHDCASRSTTCAEMRVRLRNASDLQRRSGQLVLGFALVRGSEGSGYRFFANNHGLVRTSRYL